MTHFSTAVASVLLRYDVPLDEISSTPVVMRKNMGFEGTGHGKSTWVCFNIPRHVSEDSV